MFYTEPRSVELTAWARRGWPPQIGPLTLPPTFADSPPGITAWVLAHLRNDPRPSSSLRPAGLIPAYAGGFSSLLVMNL